MDAEALSDIAPLLSGAIGPSTRAAACTVIAASSSGDEGTTFRGLLGTSPVGESILRRLLVLCADPACARLALSALVNISEDQDAALSLVRAGAVEQATESLLDSEQSQYASLYSGLLSNVTRFPAGVDALVGKGKGQSAANVAVQKLWRLVCQIDRMSNVLWMSNACSTPEGRASLLFNSEDGDDTDLSISKDENRQPLTWLLRLLSSKNEATRLAAASALRNCSMAEDCHSLLVNHTNAVGACLARLMTSNSPVPLEQVRNAPKEVRDLAIDPQRAHPEPLEEVRLLITESLLLLCKSLEGRTALRTKDAYPVLERWFQREQNEEIRNSVDSTMDRIVAAEDGDDPLSTGTRSDVQIIEDAGSS